MGKIAGRNINIDMIRILSAFMVLFCHIGQMCGTADVYTGVGARGVEVFFVLSGFLAYSSYERAGTVKKYYVARLRNIVPTFYIIYTIEAIYDILWSHFHTGISWSEIFSISGAGSPLHLRFYTFINMLVPSKVDWTWCNRYATWTISIFMFFYLLVPILFKFVDTFIKGLVAFVFSLIVKGYVSKWILVLGSDYPTEAHIDWFAEMNFWTEIHYLILGIVLYLAIKEGKEFWLGTIGVLVLMYGKSEIYTYGIIALLLVLCAAKLPAVHMPDAIRKSVYFLADGSLTLYLLHPLFIKMLCYIIPDWHWAKKCLVYLCFIIVASYLFYFFVIKRIDRLVRQRSK